jgi:RNA 2',3'-cyclic 3'-phosphodiesterase
MHVTLCFLGSVEDSRIEALRRSAAGVRAATLTLTFDRIEFWREARVLVATAQPSAAGLALAQSLQQAACDLGLAPDRKPWRPHVTLARSVLPKLLPAPMQGERPLPSPVTLRVSRFFLAESLVGAQPRRYATLASWRLR